MKFLEALHALHKSQFESKNDCLVAVLHCAMINKGNKCIGIGDEGKDINNTSELLPTGWNLNKEVYTLQYVSSSTNAKFLMKVVKVNDCLLVNLLDVGKNKAAGMSIKIDDHITDDFKTYPDAYKNLEKIERDFEKNILEAVSGSSEKVSGKTVRSGSKSDKKVEDDNYMNTIFEDHIRGGRDIEPPNVLFPQVGRNDLDPLVGYYGPGSSGGGGMLIDPRSMGPRPGPNGPLGLPRGAIPPGARFDPFTPLGRGRRLGPDPDHMVPPGYGDSFI